jgi:hypothetical protein
MCRGEEIIGLGAFQQKKTPAEKRKSSTGCNLGPAMIDISSQYVGTRRLLIGFCGYSIEALNSPCP